jgi:hypothetical protein
MRTHPWAGKAVLSGSASLATLPCCSASDVHAQEVERFLGTVADAGFIVERLTASIPPKWRVPDVLVVRAQLPAN